MNEEVQVLETYDMIWYYGKGSGNLNDQLMCLDSCKIIIEAMSFM